MSFTEKPSIFGMIQRGGQVRILMLPNVKQVTIKPIIEQTVEKETLIYTDEYVIYDRLQKWGYEHETVNHSMREYARDKDDDGFCEVHVNTMEGFWSFFTFVTTENMLSKCYMSLFENDSVIT
jgi:transposase-like protein